jgi:hypothetical protein
VARVRLRERVWGSVRDRASHDGRALISTKVARDDFSATVTPEAFDEPPDVVGVQRGVVVPDGHSLGDCVGLCLLDSRLAT